MKNNNNLIGLSLTAIVISLFVCWLYLMPAVAKNRTQVKTLKAEVDAAQVKLDNFDQAAGRITEIKSIIDQMAIAIPENQDYQSLLVSLDAIGAKDGLVVTNFQPSDASYDSTEVFPITNFSFTVTGDFSHLSTFVRDLETNLRIIKITDFSIAQLDESNLTLSVNAKTYSRTSEEATSE